MDNRIISDLENASLFEKSTLHEKLGRQYNFKKSKTELETYPTVMVGDEQLRRRLTLQEVLYAVLEDFNTTHDDDGRKRSMGDRVKLLHSRYRTSTGITMRDGVNYVIPFVDPIKPIVPMIYNTIEETYSLKSALDSSILKDSEWGLQLWQIAGDEKGFPVENFHGYVNHSEEVFNSPWLPAVNFDEELLRAFVDLIESVPGKSSVMKNKQMAFYVNSCPEGLLGSVRYSTMNFPYAAGSTPLLDYGLFDPLEEHNHKFLTRL